MLYFLDHCSHIQDLFGLIWSSGPFLAEFPLKIATKEAEETIKLVDEEVEVVEIRSLNGPVFLSKVQVFYNLKLKSQLVVWDHENTQYNSKESHVPSQVIDYAQNCLERSLNTQNLGTSLNIKSKVIVHLLSINWTGIKCADIGFTWVDEDISFNGIEPDQALLFLSLPIKVEEDVVVSENIVRG